MGYDAPASSSNKDDQGEHPLGIVPHQIRGFLSNFENMIVKGHSYDCCSACSEMVVGAYESDGWKFVRRALNEKGYIEELSGLAKVIWNPMRVFSLIDESLTSISGSATGRRCSCGF